MVTIEFNIEEIVKKIDYLSERMKNMEPFYKDISAIELGDTKLRFRDEIKPDGERWRTPITLRRDGGGSRFAPWQAWAYWKKSNFHAIPSGWHFFDKGKGDKILRDTGNLFNSIQSRYDKSSAVVGTDVRYGKYVQNLGFDFIGISDKTSENIDKIFVKYLENATK